MQQLRGLGGVGGEDIGRIGERMQEGLGLGEVDLVGDALIGGDPVEL